MRSSLTRMLHFERGRAQMDNNGALKTPLLMQFPVPVELSPICISLRTGGFRMVRVSPDNPSRVGFFELPEPAFLDEDEAGAEKTSEETGEDYVEIDLHTDDEERTHAALVRFLYEHGVRNEWGGVASALAVTPELLGQARSFFDTYALELVQVFCGVVGVTALFEGGVIEFPEPVSEEDLHDATFRRWMSRYGHVGLLSEPQTEADEAGDGQEQGQETEGEADARVPVYYNPYMLLDLALCAQPEAVGHIWRVQESAAILVHNAERGCVLLRVPLEGLSPENDDTDDTSDEGEANGLSEQGAEGGAGAPGA